MSYESAPATKMLATHCACCARPLVDAVSVEAGVGPECRRRHGFEAAQVAPDWALAVRHLDGILPLAEVLGEVVKPCMTPRDVLGAIDASDEAWGLGSPNVRRAANVVVHRIAVRQDGAEVVALTEALRALGFGCMADRIEHRIARVRVEVADGHYFVEAPFDPDAVATLRQVPGRIWDRDHGRKGATRFPLSSRAPLFDALKRAYPGAVARGPKGLFTLV